uniref:VTT domain-containing protein n=1 Tax=Pyramimonas obovata TaxID=1411642 RepID=A0A7S0RJM1_9CHLO|mmetsp:Transcript_3565/g.7397  ORF Transcript_3565/g.7397 Transcript_3565/m.7397 type:complete len:283 (+) Transcript_3565:82-930(+)|eukprot:CAMPEP_0118954838 /NCGR_PEP_ID=MMETSP1169-20130426/58973_1 /TAXON_ID=36882 /ORGANISM="Pyramimonas obovata, Strain CCMP722" /LENGTH=282 /DNA_ID=CAMNT_0006902543 /DNA_START=56 /DNA_END=904 /DNA_ORIENTATION=+
MADIEIDLQTEKEQEETRLLDEGDAETGDRLEREQMDAGTALTRGGSVFDPGADFMALSVDKTGTRHQRGSGQSLNCCFALRSKTMGACSSQGSRERVAMLVGMLLLFLVIIPRLFHHFGREVKIADAAEELRGMGFLGGIVFVGVFTLGQIIRIPGVIFLIIGNITYGRYSGWLINMASLPIVLAASFYLFRKIGGQPLQDISSPFVRRMMDKLEQSPLKVVIVLRLCFMLLPFVNLLLALSPVKFKDYMLGSMIGLLPLVTVVAIFTDSAFKFADWLGEA